GGDDDTAKATLGGAIRNVNDHRPTCDIGKRLPRQTGGRHAGGNKYQDRHGENARSSDTESGKTSHHDASLYVLHGTSKRPSFRAISPALAARGISHAYRVSRDDGRQVR